MAVAEESKVRFETKIDIGEDARETLVDMLNQHLADTFDLYSQTKQAHWNVKGIHFIQLHELFDKLAHNIEEYVDTLAERATALGGYATGTVRMAAAASTLPEYPTEAVDGDAHLKTIRDRYASFAASTREMIEKASELDPTTEDLFTEMSRKVDIDLYFLESHLQG